MEESKYMNLVGTLLIFFHFLTARLTENVSRDADDRPFKVRTRNCMKIKAWVVSSVVRYNVLGNLGMRTRECGYGNADVGMRTWECGTIDGII
jgi:hypothetical protein